MFILAVAGLAICRYPRRNSWWLGAWSVLSVMDMEQNDKALSSSYHNHTELVKSDQQ